MKWLDEIIFLKYKLVSRSKKTKVVGINQGKPSFNSGQKMADNNDDDDQDIKQFD